LASLPSLVACALRACGASPAASGTGVGAGAAQAERLSALLGGDKAKAAFVTKEEMERERSAAAAAKAAKKVETEPDKSAAAKADDVGQAMNVLQVGWAVPPLQCLFAVNPNAAVAPSGGRSVHCCPAVPSAGVPG